MRARSSAVMAAFVAACGASTPPPVAAPDCPEPAAPAVDSNFMRTEPSADAPAELAQYGRLVGTWRCEVSSHQDDDTWKQEAPSTWTFFYALGGKAIQDVWVPDEGAVGTNLRIYDPTTQSWTMVWASAGQTFFDEFTAKADGDDVVMVGERRARAAFGAHRGRITFHDVGADTFSWRYDATASGADGPWKPILRIECARRESE